MNSLRERVSMQTLKGKKGQEEIVGFALIVIIVAIIILFLLSFALKGSDKQAAESFELGSFVQSSLQYTTICQERGKNGTIQSLIFLCVDEEECSNGENSCEVLDREIEQMLEESWIVDENSPIKGYEFVIFTESKEILKKEKGNQTDNFKGTLQLIPRSNGMDAQVTLKVYD